MIGKVAKGSRVAGLIWYLWGPGKANEHVDPHVVAGWDDASRLEPPVTDVERGRRDFRSLIDGLDTPLATGAAPPKCVWHCSLRAAPGDRTLSDAEWADIVHEVLDRTGLAARDDPGGCRWVAMRHADDHVHLVVTLARQDGRRPSVSNDYAKVGEACNAVERRYGLQVTAGRDRTAAHGLTRAEGEKAHRLGHREPARDRLRREVQQAAAGASSDGEFFAGLRAGGVMVRERYSEQEPGQVTGYAVAWPGGADDPALRSRDGELIWFGGGKLAPDLSLPKLRAHWGRERTQPNAGARPARPHGESQSASSRLRLRQLVERAAGASTTDAEFFDQLRAAGVLVKERLSEHTPGQVTGYAVALDHQRDGAGEPLWHSGGKLAPHLSLPRLRQRWVGDQAEQVPPSQPDPTERAATWADTTRAVREATERLRAGDYGSGGDDAARSAADVLTSAARAIEGERGGPFTDAARAYDRASRTPYGRSPVADGGGELRLAATALTLLVRSRNGEGAAIAALAIALAGLIEAVADLRDAEGRAAQSVAARQASSHLRRPRAGAAPILSTRPRAPTIQEQLPHTRSR